MNEPEKVQAKPLKKKKKKKVTRTANRSDEFWKAREAKH